MRKTAGHGGRILASWGIFGIVSVLCALWILFHWIILDCAAACFDSLPLEDAGLMGGRPLRRRS